MDFQIFTRQDMSYNTFLKPVQLLNEFNTILLPKDLDIKYNFNNKITIINNKKKFNTTIVLASSSITILDVEYNFFHFAPSLSFDQISDLKLLIDNKEFKLSSQIDANKSCKLINGLIILDNNYYDNFDIKDNIEVSFDNTKILGKIVYKQNKHNLYRANIYNTIIHILPLQDNLEILYALNNYKNKFKKFYIKSLDTLFNDQKGSIVIRPKTKIKKEKYLIKCKGVDNNYYGEYYINDRMEIRNLCKGKYSLEFFNSAGNLIKNINTKITPYIEN